MKKYLNPNTIVLNVTTQTIVCVSVGGGESQGNGRAPQRGENIGKLYI